jgi:hypothetical protein
MKNSKCSLFVLLALFAFSLPALGQRDYEFNGGYAHVSGDQGLDGFTVGAAYNLVSNAQIYLSYDGVFDHSTFGALSLTTTGLTFVNSHLSSVFTGPRVFLPGLLHGHGNVKGHLLHPFLDAQFGEARLRQTVTAVNLGSQNASDTAFAWGFGGGGDFRLYPHFAVRPFLGFLRTHFVQTGQSRFRLGVSVVWSRQPRTE